ncbi:MAG: DUF4249 family protein [Ignavibacteriales bacterium]|nr:DUF4249 family protein [Ignavibacteriales bacterium]
MRGTRTLACTVTAALFAGACSEDLNPKGPFVESLVVFAVLSPGQAEHIVRVTTTYNPPGFDPLEHLTSNQVANATVILQVGSTVTILRDTTFPRPDAGRYQDSIRAYVYSAPTIERGSAYMLSVSAPGYNTVTATTTPPSSGILELDVRSRTALISPDVGQEYILVYATPPRNAEGHMVRVFLEYEVATQNPGVILREEIPTEIGDYKDCSTYTATYPKIRRRQNVTGRELWSFPHENYLRTILRVLDRHKGEMVNFVRVTIVLVQAEEHLYKYYHVVGGFRDEFTIRVDEPNYTNVQGGLGVFGSFSTDSLFVQIPSSFPGITCP